MNFELMRRKPGSAPHSHCFFAIAAVFLSSIAGGILFAIPVKIMPLGDSITDGSHRNMYPGAYRIALWHLCEEAGIEIDFVGSKVSTASLLPDKEHEGHNGVWSNLTRKNGNETVDLQLDSKLDSCQPDIILVLFGTNDVYHGVAGDADNVPNNIGMIIDLIHGKLPHASILVGTLTPMEQSGYESRITLINSELPDIVTTKAAEGISVFLCDLHSAMSVADLQDGVHPDSVGYRKMAEVWFETIRSITEVQTTRIIRNPRSLKRKGHITKNLVVPQQNRVFLINGRSGWGATEYPVLTITEVPK